MIPPQQPVRFLWFFVAFAQLAIVVMAGGIWYYNSLALEKSQGRLTGDSALVQTGIDQISSLPHAKSMLHELTDARAEETRTMETYYATMQYGAELCGLVSLAGLACILLLGRTGIWEKSH